jgi:hypothetical protein
MFWYGSTSLSLPREGLIALLERLISLLGDTPSAAAPALVGPATPPRAPAAPALLRPSAYISEQNGSTVNMRTGSGENIEDAQHQHQDSPHSQNRFITTLLSP